MMPTHWEFVNGNLGAIGEIVGAAARLRDLLGLSMAGYAFDPVLLPKEGLAALLTVLEKQPSQSVNELLTDAGMATPPGVRALMWLWKFDLVKVMPG